MTDQGFKDLLGFILRNKDEISEALGCFKAEDVEKGMLCIPDTLPNIHLRNLILEKAGHVLEDYSVRFDSGAVFLEADLTIRQLGPLYIRYMFTIEDLYFDENHKRLYLSYREDVRSKGNMLQAMALKAAASRGPYLQTAVQMAGIPFLKVQGYHAELNLEGIDFIKKLPDSISLQYISSDSGILKLSFHI